MKKNRKGSVGKWILTVLQEICVILAAVCIAVIFNYLVINDGNLNILENKEFELSGSFNELFAEKEKEVLDYVRLCNIFETSGQYDGDKIIDIRQYVENGIATGKETTSVGYRLDDLVRWGQNGVLFYNDVNESNGYITPHNPEEKNGLLKEEGDLTYLDQDGVPVTMGEEVPAEQNPAIDEESVVEQAQESNAEQAGMDVILVEDYLPADGRSFYDHFPNSQEWEEMYGYLETAAEKITEEFLNYKQYGAMLKQDKTNFRYFIADYENNSVYSNVPVLTEEFLPKEGEMLGADMSRAAQVIKGYGPYILVDSVSTNCQTSLNLEDQQLFYRLAGYSGILEGNYYVVMSVDTGYMVDDAFVSQKGPYYQIQPWIRWLAFGGAGAGILAFILLIVLTCKAGRVKGEKQVFLIRFDRLRTEIAAALVILAGWWLLFAAVMGLSFYRMQPWMMYIWVGSFTGLLNAAFLFGYFSLVRRIKAETLWKNSVLYWIGSFLADMIRNINTHVKFVVLLLLYIVVSLILIPASVILWLIFTMVTGVLLLNESLARSKVIEGIRRIAEGDTDYQINTAKLTGDNLLLAQEVNHIGEGIRAAVDANVKNERLKSDLITNVSHDIKTPLTSIINYVALLKRENIQDKRIKSYIDVLDNKSQRLKQLTEDLVEASKISSGNITYQITKLNFRELIYQTSGEFDERFREKGLDLILSMPEENVIVEADGRRLWRVLENIYNNVAKYAMEHTRVYADMKLLDGKVEFSLKNISKQSLNIEADELTERFIRGDVSRSTEGSGLGLSIAKNLTEAQNGEFDIYLDGDLFRVTIRFPRVPENPVKDSGGDAAEDGTSENGAEEGGGKENTGKERPVGKRVSDGTSESLQKPPQEMGNDTEPSQEDNPDTIRETQEPVDTQRDEA